MLAQQRAQFTTQKIRRGGLPEPTDVRAREITAGTGLLCDGCGETIHPNENLHRVHVRGFVELRLHGECYSAYVAFKAR